MAVSTAFPRIGSRCYHRAVKVTLLEPAGYCAGVTLALRLAEKTKREHPDKRVAVLGMLVHNEDALKELSAAGVETIYRPGASLTELVDDVPPGTIVVLSAHGHPAALEEKLKARGLTFVDATCPKVEEVFRAIRKETDAGHEVIYVGKAGHPEAEAALSLSPKVHLYPVKDGFDYGLLSDPSPFVASQTTLFASRVDEIVEEIKERMPGARFLDTVCGASKARQHALLSVPDDVDVIFVLGSRISSNTRTLYELAKKHYPDRKIVALLNAGELNEEDLIGKRHAAIICGASTPRRIALELLEKLRAL